LRIGGEIIWVNPQKEGILRIGDKNPGSYPQKWAILRI
jgi:hypothetical protein